MLRDHSPIIISEFNGLWQRGDTENTPIDHFTECNNIKFVGTSGFATRDGIGISQTVALPLQNVKRIYNYPTHTANTLIVLVINDSDEGEIYHVVNATTVFGPLLTIAGMTDFAFVPYGGRGYISPFTTFDVGGLNVEKGLENEFVYVYAGDGTAARKAAGVPLSGNMTIANGAAGHTDAGTHVFGFVNETISGAYTAPGLLESFVTVAGNSVSFGSIPTSGDPNVVARHLVATKIIVDYNGNLTGSQFFFVPDATISNNTDTFLNNISFFDADLLDDASYLLDNFAEIPAGAVMTMYHDRLVVCTFFDDISSGIVSAIGEPESFNQVDGRIVMPPDGNPITNAIELRDILYGMKRSRTGSWTDNGDNPSTWPYILVDTALGSCVHGIATVLDSGGTNVDYLLIATYQGFTIFNGRYITPELSWKIENLWQNLDRNEFRKIQIVNEPIKKLILIVLPDGEILVGNYGNGMDPKKIRWAPWTFSMSVNTIAIVNIDEIVFGAEF